MTIRWKKQIAAAAVTAAVLTLGSLSGPRKLMAQVRAALVQDVDSPGHAPFQASVTINVNNFNFTPVTIPAGKRLVVDHIEIHGAAQSISGPVQPIAIVAASVAGSPSVSYYYAWQPSSTVSGQFYSNFPTVIYADTLQIGPAFAGFTPDFMAAGVDITGHLISLP
jgi:hypothetical protein